MLLACLATDGIAATADEQFADGNRLFREGLYWAALLRYRQAEAAGLDNPVLHYNSGVAHYRAGQYGRAREAFLEARQDPRLARFSEYNLGLTAYAAGRDDEAMAHFRQVRDARGDTPLAELAERGMSRLQAGLRPDGSDGDTASAAEPDTAVGSGFGLQLTIGAGSDDNVFRSPAEPYTDNAAAGAPTVEPVVHSGVYYPVRLLAKYSVQSFDNESFFASYRLNSRYYQDPELENANETSHQLAFGTEFARLEEKRERKIYSAFTIARHDEVWFDADDGTERVFDDEPLGDRLSYTRYGPELWLRQSFSRLSFNLHGLGQIWNYEDTDELPEYDHEYLSAGISAQYRFTSTSLLRVTADAYQRHFGERPSYNLDGQQPIDNPAVRYNYTDYGATARQRITRFMWFGLGYSRTTRTDEHVGYYDYVRDNYNVEFNLIGDSRFRLHAAATYAIYGYTNARVFNVATAGRKTLETAEAFVRASWRFTEHLSVSGEYAYRDSTSNDARIAYTRSSYMLGVTWRQ